MASRGTEDDLHSSDLFDCSVCLESLINKYPRLLHCGHTFCTPCLQQLVTGGTVSCPKCRKSTKLPQGCIEDLPQNVDLYKMWERELIHTPCCQMCQDREIPSFICLMCNNRLICRKCAGLHKEIPALKTHHILPLRPMEGISQEIGPTCTEHKKSIEYFCSQCFLGICVSCISSSLHIGHKEKIVDLVSAMDTIKHNIHSVYRKCCNHVEHLNKGQEAVIKELQKTKMVKEELRTLCKDLHDKLIQMEGKLQIVQKTETSLGKLLRQLQSYQGQVEHIGRLMGSMQEVNTQLSLSEAKESYEKASQIERTGQSLSTTKYANVNYEPGTYKTTSTLGRLTIREQIFEGVRNSLSMEEQFENMAIMRQRDHGSDESKNNVVVSMGLELKEGTAALPGAPNEIHSVGDGTVLVVGQKYLHRINLSGDITMTYDIEQGLCIASACVYGRSLFIGHYPTSNNISLITRMNLNDSGKREVFRPGQVRFINQIIATGESEILICQTSDDAAIIEYNIYSSRINKRDLNTLGIPTYLSLQKVCFVQLDMNKLTSYVVLTSDGVYLYDRKWTMVSKIINLNVAQGLTVTPTERLLIACQGSIREYTLDGNFIKELLGPDSGVQLQNPFDLVSVPPVLWVLDRKKGQLYCRSTLKMYTVD